MTYLFHIITGMGIVIFQTTILPYLPFGKCYDLLIPFVLYLAIFRPYRESLPFILFFGMAIDNLSSGPFGLHLISYLWLFVVVSRLLRFMHVRNRILLAIVVLSGVLLENAIFFGTLMVSRDGSLITPTMLISVAEQSLWAVCTGPLLIDWMDSVQQVIEERFGELFPKENGGG